MAVSVNDGGSKNIGKKTIKMMQIITKSFHNLSLLIPNVKPKKNKATKKQERMRKNDINRCLTTG
jgi:hypothetical protein